MIETWTCHVCGEERPDEKIAVRTYPMAGLPGAEINKRYCNDRTECFRGALQMEIAESKKEVSVEEKSFGERLKSEFDELVRYFDSVYKPLKAWWKAEDNPSTGGITVAFKLTGENGYKLMVFFSITPQMRSVKHDSPRYYVEHVRAMMEDEVRKMGIEYITTRIK